MFLKIVTFTVQ